MLGQVTKMDISPGLATIIGAVIAAAAAVAVAMINRGKKARKLLEKTQGKINKPTTGQSVPCAITCEGEASAGNAEGEITFFLAIETTGLIWPKDAMVIPDDSGHWAATICQEGYPGTLSVSLWAASPQGAKEVQAWFDRGRATNDYPGLSMLSGARRVAAVSGLKLQT